MSSSSIRETSRSDIAAAVGSIGPIKLSRNDSLRVKEKLRVKIAKRAQLYASGDL